MAWDWLKDRFGRGPSITPQCPSAASLPAWMESAASRLRWIEAADNPWGVPVLDVRPVTLVMRSTTGDDQCAANALSYGGEDGASFDGQISKSARRISAALKFPVDDRAFLPGALFVPRAMEHKWALFSVCGRFLFVRSWQRRVLAVAHTRFTGEFLEVDAIDGTFTSEDEDPAFTVRVADFLLRSHALGLAYPAPLPAGLEQDPAKAAIWCLQMFGNQVQFATPHTIPYQPPEKPMRTYSELHLAVARGDSARVITLLDLKTPVDLVDRGGLPPLHWAAARPDTAMLSLLLERGSPIDLRSAEGATALMTAVQRRRAGIVAFLLDKGADPNARDERGFTALHRAAEMGEKEIVRMLLDRGAAPNVDAQGQTPRSLAAAHSQTEIVELLDSH